MKVYNILFVLVITLINVVLTEHPHHHPRYKIRGPPMPPRPPPQFMKKWYQPPPPPPPPQNPQRRPQRPIPVHMPISHKIPMGPPQSAVMKRPIPAPPVRAFWKNTQTTYRTPVEKHYVLPPVAVVQDKFVAAPTINLPEYDFQLQTNNIPTQVKPIKQVGEKGPIHTIPAPKLSPADKPPIVEEVKYHPNLQLQVQQQQNHQYQVTEVAADKSYPQQQQIQETPQSISYQTTNFQQPQQQPEEQLNLYNKEVYHVVNVYPQEQQPLETYNLPIFQQQQETEISPQYLQALLAQQPQLFQQTDQQQQQQQQQQTEVTAADKISFQPEYHTFNYEEPRQKSVKATYTLEQQDAENQQQIQRHDTFLDTDVAAIARRPLESLAQSEYIQNYFRTDNADNNSNNSNKIQPDAKPSEPTRFDDGDDDAPAAYSSLPNKETAEVLATLQAAGKFNSNLMKLPKKSVENPLSIYVPDDSSKRLQADEEYEGLFARRSIGGGARRQFRT